jgi:hypothetical protein
MEIKFAIEALENNYWSIQQHQVLMPLIPKDKLCDIFAQLFD